MSDFVGSYQAFKAQAVAISGASDGVLHLHAGLAIYLVAQVALRTRRGSVYALLIVIVAEAANECLDWLFWDSWRWGNTRLDIVATLFWPVLITLCGRYRRILWTSAHRRLLIAAPLKLSESETPGDDLVRRNPASAR